RYYLGRVVKINFTQNQLMDALAKVQPLTIGKFSWAISDISDQRSHSENPYIFGRLSKFHKEGHVTIVDTNLKSQVDAPQKNLLAASSPFIYLPKYSGLAYLHVWNGIQETLFSSIFKKLIEAYHGNFFIDCHIEPVADYRAFTSKLREFDVFTEISAKVYPPNPLFGRLWESLNDYVKKRNASELAVKETSENGKGTGIQTKIAELMSTILEEQGRAQIADEIAPADITDAALLMAADGYGHGKVTGIKNGSKIVIRTSETQKNFLFSKEPMPTKLAEEADKHFKNISIERDMGH
ncbi:MAG: hypothetical protein AABY51_10530, partial [Deltaproteobacteria bacterium]